MGSTIKLDGMPADLSIGGIADLDDGLTYDVIMG